jgi:hypothetical protein
MDLRIHSLVINDRTVLDFGRRPTPVEYRYEDWAKSMENRKFMNFVLWL